MTNEYDEKQLKAEQEWIQRIAASERRLHDCKVRAAKVEMFSEMLEALDLINDRMTIEVYYVLGHSFADFIAILKRARQLQKGELP